MIRAFQAAGRYALELVGTSEGTAGRRAERGAASGRRARRAGGRLPVGWPWVVAAMLALASLGIGAKTLAGYEWDRVVDFRSAFRFDLPPAEATPPLADRLVVVVIDGLRLDVARELPTLTTLGEAGSFLVARAAEPSLSFPGWTTLVTGAPPEVSGATTNSYDGPVLVDGLFASARRAGLATAIAGSEGWRQLFGADVDLGFYVPDADVESDPVVGRHAVQILEEDEPAFLLVHLVDVDHVGHASGLGDEYRATAARADRIVASIVEAAGDDAAVVVTSDHGHIDEGGHGGSEDDVTSTPVVLAGEGFTTGASGEIAQSDLAPTLAAVLGVGRPAHATGTLRLGLLNADDEELAVIRSAQDEAAARFFSRATEALGGEGDTAAALSDVRRERARHDLLARLPFVLLVTLALAAGVALATQRLDGPAMAIGVLVFIGLLIALFFSRGSTLSFSQFDSEEQVRSFLAGRFLDALIAAAGAGIVTGLTAGRRGWSGSFQAGLGTSAWAMLVLGLGVAAFVTIYGWGYTWRLPNLPAAFAQYLALLSMFAAGAAAAAVGLLSMGAAWAASRGRP